MTGFEAQRTRGAEWQQRRGGRRGGVLDLLVEDAPVSHHDDRLLSRQQEGAEPGQVHGALMAASSVRFDGGRAAL